MKRFMIEREIPGASELTPAELAGIAPASNAVVDWLGVPYTWVTSYVAGDKVYCVHEAEDAEASSSTPGAAGSPPTPSRSSPTSSARTAASLTPRGGYAGGPASPLCRPARPMTTRPRGASATAADGRIVHVATGTANQGGHGQRRTAAGPADRRSSVGGASSTSCARSCGPTGS